jgi:hypothetical protein
MNMKKDQNWPQESINNKEDLITQLDVNEKPRKMMDMNKDQIGHKRESTIDNEEHGDEL